MSDAYGNYRADMGSQGSNPPAAIGFIVLVAGNPNSLGTTALAGSFAFDTVGLLLYYSADGTTWTVVTSGGGGGSSGNVLSGHGAPVSTPSVASVYTDLDTAKFYYWDGAAWQILIS